VGATDLVIPFGVRRCAALGRVGGALPNGEKESQRKRRIQPRTEETLSCWMGLIVAENQSTELELYKLAVEMADRTSARRAVANTFFLTVNTGLAALLGGSDLRWYVAAAGIVFTLTWWWLLQSYRRLNQAKFAVINAIEPGLPVRLFSDEWRHLQEMKKPAELWPPRKLGAWLGGYHELGTIERVVPLAFAAIYLAELVRQVAG
jgi:hypothetical protein